MATESAEAAAAAIEIRHRLPSSIRLSIFFPLYDATADRAPYHVDRTGPADGTSGCLRGSMRSHQGGSRMSGVLDPLGPVGAGDAKILINATLVMLAIVVPTILLA